MNAKRKYPDLRGTLVALSGQQNTIVVQAALVDFAGSLEGGMLLSQLLYWTPRAQIRGGWIAKSDSDLVDELHLTQYRVRKARKELEALEILETKVAKFAGSPTVHYRIAWEALVERWTLWLRNIDLAKSQDHGSCEIERSSTETTRDDETEIIDPPPEFSDLFPEKERPIPPDPPQRPEGMTDTEWVAARSLESIRSYAARNPVGEGNTASPVGAGGADRMVDQLVDGLCRFNNLPSGIKSLPDKERESWRNRIAEILEQWGRPELDQTGLVWRAYVSHYGWRENANPFYSNFPTELGMIVAAVRDGGITEESLEEANAPNRSKDSNETGGGPDAERVGQALTDRARGRTGGGGD